MKKILAVFFALFFMAPGLRADDIDIYGTTSVSLEPNVLIIFDTSGSMATQDVPGDPYDSSGSYLPASYNSSTIYRYEWSQGRYRWKPFCSVSQLESSTSCQSIKTDLLTLGYAEGTRTCGGRGYNLRHGNYLNYSQSGSGGMRRRTDVAKDAIRALIDETEGVRFGLMAFNFDEGGRLVAPCGTDKATLISRVNSMPADSWTPLAETLAEAGLYFAGKRSWFNSGVTYTSPMEERCQKNYIILMTDGAASRDSNSKLWKSGYINGNVIGDYDGDQEDFREDDKLLDDVAKYLAVEDCNPALGINTTLSTQLITTYTIGFDIQGLDTQLLQDTADNGGGKYYVAKNISTLKEAFKHIISNINEVNTYFVAPVVPVDQLNKSFAGDWTYFAFFKPQLTGRWFGNIKKYQRINGKLFDQFGKAVVTGAGVIDNNAQSFWSGDVDGPSVTKGGIGEKLLGQVGESGSNRRIYTYISTVGEKDLTAGVNRLVDSNSSLILHNGPGGNPITGTARKKLIEEDVHGKGKSWIMGDIIHSEPVIAHYKINGKVTPRIYVGANDGMLHCFDDSDGTEKWAFVPPPHLDRLAYLQQAEHKYYMDGSPTVFNENGSPSILFIGERRGGDRYYALDISSPDAPRWKYQVDPDILGSTAETLLGQSWSKAQICRMATSSGGTEAVFLLSGGYSVNQDNMSPAALDDSGRAVFAVHIADGRKATFNFNGSTPKLGMTNAIVDVNGVYRGAVESRDDEGNKVINDVVSRIYAGDLKGNVFVFNDDLEISMKDGEKIAENKAPDGSWFGRKLCSVADRNGKQQKIFHAPQSAVSCGSFGEETVFFGTGDRAHPDRLDVVNSLYAVTNNWIDGGFSRSDLINITAGFTGSTDEKMSQVEAVAKGAGWYIDLQDEGEKVYSRPIVIGNIVVFITYTPSKEVAEGTDPCEGAAVEGISRLYKVRACYRNYENIAEPIISVHKLKGPPADISIVVDKNGKVTIGGVEFRAADADGGGGPPPPPPPPELSLPHPDMYFWRRF